MTAYQVPAGQDGLTATVTAADPAVVTWPFAAVVAAVSVRPTGGPARIGFRGSAAPGANGVSTYPAGQTTTIRVQAEATPITMHIAADANITVEIVGYRSTGVLISEPYLAGTVGPGGTVADATTSTKGVAVLMGGTASAPTVPWTSVTGGPTALPPTDGSVTNAKVATNAAISLDKTADGTTNRVFTSTEKTKLAGVASGATANPNAASIPDFVEAVQDAVAALLGSGSNVILNYDDAANSLTISATGAGGTGLDVEQVRDAIGVALVGVGNIAVTVNDAADTITISTTATQNSTDAALRDRDSHTDGTIYKGFTATEKTKLANLSALASSGRLADALDLTSTAAAVGKVVSVASLSPLQLAIIDPPYAGDLPEYSQSAQTAPVAADGLLLKTTRFNSSGGVINQTLPAAVPGRVVAFGWDGGTAAVNLIAATRTDPGAGTTSGSATITDAAITAADLGHPVSGAGIPANSYVGTVTPGVSFLLSSSALVQTNVNATATATVPITVSDVIGGSVTTVSPIPAVGDNVKLHCTHTGRWRFLDGFKSSSGLDAIYPRTDQAAPSLGAVPTVSSLSPLRYSLAVPPGTYTDEQAQDAAAVLFTSGTHTGVSFAYDDATGKVNATVTGGGSGGGYTVRSVSANTTAISGELLGVDASGGARTIAPPSSPTAGDRITFVKVDATANPVTWAATTSGDTQGVSLTSRWAAATVVYDGSQWLLVSINSVSTSGGGYADPDAWLGFAATTLVTQPNVNVTTANRTFYCRVTRGSIALASKIGLIVGASSGNVAVAVHRNTGTGLNAAPGNQVAASGVIACPAAGYAEIPLSTTVAVAQGDWLALSADNTTATFGGGGSTGTNGMVAPFAVYANGFPVPASPSGLTAYGRVFNLVAVA